MAKPSVANIKPPSKTAVWVPPKTTWDLNSDVDLLAAGNSYAAEGTTQYDTLTDSINEPAPEEVNFGYEDYDYVFFGVNGGENETVRAMDDKDGVIVTGNGKDVITGERWVLDSDHTTVVYEKPADGDLLNYTYKSAGEMLVFAGNGSDYVHGGAANDILFGENGPDTLNGGADEGSANYVPADDGQVTENGNSVFVWETDPNGQTTFILASGDQAGQLRKEGVFIEGTDDVHQVFSFVAAQTGDYQIRLTNGVVLDDSDSPNGDSGDEPASNPFTIHVEANQKYYFSFEDDDGGQVEVYLASTVVPDPNQGQAHVNPITQQGYNAESAFDFPDGGNGTFDFEAGDQLIGGNGPDQFVWDANDVNNVDLIWDYNQGDGGAVDPLEGDTLLLIGVTDTNGDSVVDTSDLTTFLFDVDGDPLTEDALVIYVGENQAIGLAGITDINQVNVLFG